MPRTLAILQSEFPYHVSARCINKDWFSIPMDTVWDIMCTQLSFITQAYGVKIHSFVLMSNHFHLLISTPNANLSEAMCNFMGETSRALTAAGNRINQTYGSRHYRSVIMTHHYFLHAYKYVYLNPVMGGLCHKVEDYKYSSLSGLLGQSKMLVPAEEDLVLFENVESTLRWLNEIPDEKKWNLIKHAMRRKEFRIAKDRDTKRPSCLEFDML